MNFSHFVLAQFENSNLTFSKSSRMQKSSKLDSSYMLTYLILIRLESDDERELNIRDNLPSNVENVNVNPFIAFQTFKNKITLC